MPSTIPHATFDSIVHANWVWSVNGNRASEKKADGLADRFESEEVSNVFYASWDRGTLCGYCNTPMETPSFRIENRGSEDWNAECCYSLASCPYCCHWRFRAGECNDACMDAPTNVIAESVAKKFDSALPECCVAELAVQFRRNDSLWHTIDPKRMERVVADIFRANYQNAEVMHVGKPGDLGIDILFVDTGSADWLIQVKRRESADAVEGFETLQRLLGTLVLEGKVRGIIATTAKRFSRQLLTQKRRAEHRGFTIELLDRGMLNRMLNPMLPRRPWLDLMKADFFWALDEEVRGHFISHTTIPGERPF